MLNQPLSINKFGKKLGLCQSTGLINMAAIGPLARILRHDLSKIEQGHVMASCHLFYYLIILLKPLLGIFLGGVIIKIR